MKSMRKVIPALALLLVSAVILSSASYAWFTMSRQVNATGMNVTVTAPNNLLIDDTADDDWSEAETITKTGVILEPASTIDGSAFFVLDDESIANANTGALVDDKSVLVEGDAAVATEDGTPAAGAYYDFKYRIKTEGGTTVDVALTDLTITDNASTKSMQPARVAILAGTGADPTDVAGIYNVTSGENQAPGKAVKKVKSAAESAVSVRDTVTYAKVWNATTLAAETKDELDDDCLLFTVPGTGVEYVTIRVWYEGEDKKCTATLGANASFKVDAQFNAIG